MHELQSEFGPRAKIHLGSTSKLMRVWRSSCWKGSIHRAGGDLVLPALTPDSPDLYRGCELRVAGCGLQVAKLGGNFWQAVGDECVFIPGEGRGWQTRSGPTPYQTRW